MSGALLTFDKAGCVRGGRTLFAQLDLRLEAGGALLVTGPNGAGKSSLIRLAAGLLRPAAGRVERSAAAALADESPALDPRAPLGRALGFWAGLDGSDARAGLAAFGLERLREVPVRMLSTGQRKRAVLARVAASGAPLWLLDEPANGLDEAGLDCLAAAVSAHRAGGGAVLAASHQPLPLGGAQRLALA